LGASGRVFAVIALLVASVAVGAVLLGAGGGDYRVVALARDAGQLVRGNLVKVGGVEIGRVESIELDDRNRARLVLRIEDEDFHPLHRGTTVQIRSTSLSSVAGRSVALHPGRNDAPPIPDRGEIATEDVGSVVELDQIVNTLDAETRAGLQDVVHGGATALAQRGPATRAALDALAPALGETAATAAEVVRDQRAFRRAIVTAAGVAGAVAGEREALERGLAGGAVTFRALAEERRALDDALRRGPDVLRATNSTLADLRFALEELRPALRLARPAAERLRPTLAALRPVLRRARPVVPELRGLLRDATAVLRASPDTERAARPAFGSAASALRAADPVVAGLRVYTPDVVAGFLNGFGGTTAGYYDANGHYVRISLQGNPFTFQGAASATEVPSFGTDAYALRRGVLARCPGAATQPHADGSNPWRPPEAPCRAEDDAP
jgi:phospholipid/cholesterol/gamma-HCH transport system substrate-binding protein